MNNDNPWRGLKAQFMHPNCVCRRFLVRNETVASSAVPTVRTGVGTVFPTVPFRKSNCFPIHVTVWLDVSMDFGEIKKPLSANQSDKRDIMFVPNALSFDNKRMSSR